MKEKTREFFTKVKHQIRKVISIGCVDTNNIWTISRIKLINITSLFCVFILYSLAIFNIYIGESEILIITDFILGTVMIIPFIFSMLKKHTLARLSLIILAYIIITIFVIFFGNHVYFQFYLVPVVGLPLIFFTDEIGKWKWVLAFIGYPLWVFLKVRAEYYDHLFTIGDEFILRITSVSVIFIASGFLFSAFNIQIEKNSQNLAKINDKFKALSITDPLTNIYNSRHIFDQLNHFLHQAKTKKASLSFLIFDLDYFKEINDEYGHDAGDYILRYVADQMRFNFDNNALFGRIGGDEFSVIFIDDHHDNIMNQIENFKSSITDKKVSYNDLSIQVSASFGLAHYSVEIKDSVALYKAADIELYKAKKNGKNQISFIDLAAQ